MNLNVSILDDFQDSVPKLSCATKLETFGTKIFTNNIKGVNQLADRLKDTDILICVEDRTQITGELLKKLPRLKLIAQIGTIGQHIDLEACTSAGISVIDGISNLNSLAEFTWAFILTTYRRLPQYINNLKHGVWQQSGLKSLTQPDNFALGGCVANKCLGIVGFHPVVKKIIEYAQVFSMKIFLTGCEQDLDEARQLGVETTSNMMGVLGKADILCWFPHPLREYMTLTSEHFACMSKTSLLVNTLTTKNLNYNELAQSLAKGRPGFAALDVYESYPLSQGFNLLRLENCLCTPSIAKVEKEAYEEQFAYTLDKIFKYLRGDDSHIHNKEVLHTRRTLVFL